MEELLGPLAVLYSWQSLLLAFGVASLTHVIKGALDVKLGGKEERQKRLWANRVVLPLTPIALGAVGGAVVPLHPEALMEYLTAHAVVGPQYYLALMAYGGAVGQFSDYVWHRYSGLRDDVKKRKKANQGPPKALPDGFVPPGIVVPADAPADAPAVEPSPAPSSVPAAPAPSSVSSAPTAAPAKPLKMPDGFAPPQLGSGENSAPSTPLPSTQPTSTPAEPSTPAEDSGSSGPPRRRRSAFRR